MIELKNATLPEGYYWGRLEYPDGNLSDWEVVKLIGGEKPIIRLLDVEYDPEQFELSDFIGPLTR